MVATRQIKIVLTLLALFVSLWVSFTKIPVTFHVYAETEKVSFTTWKQPSSRLPLDTVVIFKYQPDSSFTCSGSLDLADSTTVIVQRVQKGSVGVNLKTDRLDGSVGVLYGHDLPQEVLPFNIDITISNLSQRLSSGRGVVLPIEGTITLGEDYRFVTTLSPPILISGKIEMVSKTLFGESSYSAGEVNLFPGDMLEPTEQITPSYGLVFVTEGSGLKVAYIVKAKKLRVTHYGGERIEVAASILDRLIHDPAVQGPWLFFLACLGFFKYFPQRRA